VFFHIITILATQWFEPGVVAEAYPLIALFEQLNANNRQLVLILLVLFAAGIYTSIFVHFRSERQRNRIACHHDETLNNIKRLTETAKQARLHESQIKAHEQWFRGFLYKFRVVITQYLFLAGTTTIFMACLAMISLYQA
jgi:hypothetical protein